MSSEASTHASSYEWPETDFIFALRRSGHHGVMAWMKKCYESAGIPTVHADDAYCGHLKYDNPRIIAVDEAQEMSQDSGRLMVSYEDYPYHQRGELEIYSAIEGTTSRDILIMRDWPNMVASRLAMLARDKAAGRRYLLTERQTWDDTAELWTEYAQIMAENPDDPTCINFNRWFAEHGYDEQIAERFGLASHQEFKLAVPQNGGGSSFHGRAYDGNASSMGVLTRWRDLAPDLIPEFHELMASYPAVRGLNQEVFGFSPVQAMADLALKHS